MTPRKIVVVDNDPAIRTFASMFLTKQGYQIKTAEDGLAALRILEDFDPDVMFVDLVMPNISGDKLCSIIRSVDRFKDTFMVLLSAISAEEQGRYVEYGFDAMIAKGPLKETGQHILGLLKQLEAGSLSRSQHLALGLEAVHKREITKELLWTRRHYELILGNLSEGVLEVARDDRIVFANKAATSLLGIPETRLLGSLFIALFSGLDREAVLGHLKQQGAGTRRMGPFAFRGRRIAMTMVNLAEDAGSSRIVILGDVTDKPGA